MSDVVHAGPEPSQELASDLTDWITLTSFRPDRTLTIEEFEEVGAYFQVQAVSVNWHFGDWCAYGDSIIGEEWWQFIEEGLMDQAAVKRAIRTVNSFPFEDRSNSLSFEHHAIIAEKVKGDLAERKRWVQRAIEGHLSPAKLAVAIRDYQDSIEVDSEPVVEESAVEEKAYDEALVRLSVRVPYGKAALAADLMETVKADIRTTFNGDGIPVIGIESAVSFS